MAECRGRECVCCTDPRPQHGLRLAFVTFSSFSCPPAICTEGVILNKLYNTVYSTYFCKYAIGQTKDAFYCCGRRKVRFWIHCHCSNPGSLQCLSAGHAMMQMVRQMCLYLQSSNCLPSPQICCNSWLCCPLKSLGRVQSKYGHYFVFQMSEISGVSVDAWKAHYRVEKIPVHESLVFVCVFCDCNTTLSVCVEKCAAFYNYLRVMMCCCYDRFKFGNNGRLYLCRDEVFYDDLSLISPEEESETAE